MSLENTSLNQDNEGDFELIEMSDCEDCEDFEDFEMIEKPQPQPEKMFVVTVPRSTSPKSYEIRQHYLGDRFECSESLLESFAVISKIGPPVSKFPKLFAGVKKFFLGNTHEVDNKRIMRLMNNIDDYKYNLRLADRQSIVKYLLIQQPNHIPVVSILLYASIS